MEGELGVEAGVGGEQALAFDGDKDTVQEFAGAGRAPGIDGGEGAVAVGDGAAEVGAVVEFFDGIQKRPADMARRDAAVAGDADHVVVLEGFEQTDVQVVVLDPDIIVDKQHQVFAVFGIQRGVVAFGQADAVVVEDIGDQGLMAHAQQGLPQGRGTPECVFAQTGGADDFDSCLEIHADSARLVCAVLGSALAHRANRGQLASSVVGAWVLARVLAQGGGYELYVTWGAFRLPQWVLRLGDWATPECCRSADLLGVRRYASGSQQLAVGIGVESVWETTMAKRSTATGVRLWVATRKGAFRLESDRTRKQWQLSAPQFLGHIVHHVMQDPRDPRVVLIAAKTGHLGPTLFRSGNGGKTFKEVTRPPAFASQPEGFGRSVDHTFWLTPAHANEPGVWYAGTSPQGLFRSDDGGQTWSPFSMINGDPEYRRWFGSAQDGTPDGPKLHSILVDPRDPQHLYFGMSGGGVHESRDGGKTFAPLIEGLDVVTGFDVHDPMYHDPHCLRLCPSNPDRLYQQNHCGIYRLDRPGTRWQRIGTRMPKRVGDIGFPIVVNPHDDQQAWVFPMDGSDVWPRVSPGGKPAVYTTRDGGSRWHRQDQGLPAEHAWWTVKRQAMSVDGFSKTGVYFGTTSGELWGSRDGGERWSLIARHLPEIYAIEAVTV